MDILLAFVIALVLVLIAQIIRTVVLRPVIGSRCKTVMVLYADGSGETLEQCVRSSHYIAARCGVPLELVDSGLNAEGLLLAKKLSDKYGFCIR